MEKIIVIFSMVFGGAVRRLAMSMSLSMTIMQASVSCYVCQKNSRSCYVFLEARQAPGNVNDHHASVSELLCVKKRWVGRVSDQRCGEQQFKHKYFPQFPRKSTTFWDIRGNGKNTMEILSKKSPIFHFMEILKWSKKGMG